MSKKILSHLFNYAIQNGARDLVILNRKDQISLACHLLDGGQKNFSLPQKLEQDLLISLRHLAAVAPGELTTRKYCKIYDREHQLVFYLTITSDREGEKIVININEQPVKHWRLNQLGLQAADLKVVRATLRKRSGLIIVSSPNGQGKSATLRALLEEINRPDLNIYVLEKNPLFPLPGVNYLLPTPTNWEKVMQHDSEVIVIDDLDDKQQLENALRAATSGRLVLGAMTAHSSWEVLGHILQVSLPWKLKLESLKMIINQELRDLKPLTRQKNNKNLKRRQQIGLFEIFTGNEVIKEFILKAKEEIATQTKKLPDRAKKFWIELATLAHSQGFKPLTIDRQRKIKDGLIKKIE